MEIHVLKNNKLALFRISQPFGGDDVGNHGADLGIDSPRPATDRMEPAGIQRRRMRIGRLEEAAFPVFPCRKQGQKFFTMIADVERIQMVEEGTVDALGSQSMHRLVQDSILLHNRGIHHFSKHASILY